MRRDRYEIGHVLCDMHDGFKGLPDNLGVAHHTKFRTDNATAAVTALAGKHPGNKFLIVISVDMNAASHDIVAVYSYDNRYFGVVELAYAIADDAQA